MLKKGFSKAARRVRIIFTLAGLLFVLQMLQVAELPIVAHAASSRGAVHVTNAQIVVSEQGAIYRPDRNLYLVGPTGWVEWHFTVKEKITDLVGLDYFFERGENEDVFSYKSAILDRVIDGQTLVFRFEPNNPQSAYLDSKRISEVGVIYY